MTELLNCIALIAGRLFRYFEQNLPSCETNDPATQRYGNRHALSASYPAPRPRRPPAGCAARRSRRHRDRSW